MLVYRVCNKINGKLYFGQTRYTAEHRWRGHVQQALRNRGSSVLHAAIRKYGELAFELSVVFRTTSSEQLNAKEIEFIQKFRTTNSKYGYNLTTGGDTDFRVKRCSAKLRKKRKEFMRGNQNVRGMRWSSKENSIRCLNSCWVYREEQERFILKTKLEKFLKTGWLQGRSTAKIWTRNASTYFWLNNGHKNFRVKREHITDWETAGWVRGKFV